MDHHYHLPQPMGPHTGHLRLSILFLFDAWMTLDNIQVLRRVLLNMITGKT